MTLRCAGQPGLPAACRNSAVSGLHACKSLSMADCCRATCPECTGCPVIGAQRMRTLPGRAGAAIWLGTWLIKVR